MFILALLFSLIWPLDNQTSQFEGRYLWVVRNTLTTKQSIDRMLDFATLNRFNHLLVQVRGRGDAYYKSDLVPKSHFIQQIDFDPLNYLIPKAKEKGIKTFGLLGKGGGKLLSEVENAVIVPSDSTARTQEAHIFILHYICELLDEKFT